METIINAKELRANLAEIVKRIRRGERFTVLYRSRPVCKIVPLSGNERSMVPLENDPLYHAGSVGESGDGRASLDHDATLYG